MIKRELNSTIHREVIDFRVQKHAIARQNHFSQYTKFEGVTPGRRYQDTGILYEMFNYRSHILFLRHLLYDSHLMYDAFCSLQMLYAFLTYFFLFCLIVKRE